MQVHTTPRWRAPLVSLTLLCSLSLACVREGVATGAKAGETRTHDVTPAMRGVHGGRLRDELVIAGASVAGAALVVGVATGIAAISLSSNAEEKLETIAASGAPCQEPPERAACADVLALRSQQSALTNAALWSLVGTGAAGITTAIFFLTTRGKPQAATFVVAPTVSSAGAELGITGRW